MLTEIIGNRIKELRLSRVNLNQEDFANILHMDRTYISRVESGKQNLTIEILNEICNGLRVSLSAFFEPFNTQIETHNGGFIRER